MFSDLDMPVSNLRQDETCDSTCKAVLWALCYQSHAFRINGEEKRKEKATNTVLHVVDTTKHTAKCPAHSFCDFNNSPSLFLPLSRSLELSIEARCLMIDASNERQEKGEEEKAWLLLLGDSTIRHLRLLRLWLPSSRDSNTWSEDRRRRSTGEDDYDREKTDAAGNDFQRP